MKTLLALLPPSRRQRRVILEIAGLSAVGLGLVLAGLSLPATPAPGETAARAATVATTTQPAVGSASFHQSE